MTTPEAAVRGVRGDLRRFGARTGDDDFGAHPSGLSRCGHLGVGSGFQGDLADVIGDHPAEQFELGFWLATFGTNTNSANHPRLGRCGESA